MTARLLRERARVTARPRVDDHHGRGLSGITLWELSSITWRQQQRDAIGEAPSLFVLALRRDSAGVESFPQDPRLRVMFDAFLAPRDAAALARADYATRIVTTSPGMLAATPGDRPAEELPVRFASAFVFQMFALQFRFGGPYRDGDPHPRRMHAEPGAHRHGALRGAHGRAGPAVGCPAIQPEAKCAEQAVSPRILVDGEGLRVSVTLSSGAEFTIPLRRTRRQGTALENH